MDFGAWTVGNRDPLRRRRLVVSSGLGLGIVVGSVALMLAGSKNVGAEEKEEQPIAVELAKEPEPEPEPEPPPPTEAPKPAAKAPKLSTPTTISDEKLAETEVKKDLLQAEPEKEEEKPKEVEKPVVEAPKPIEAPKPVAPKKPTGPIRITEEVTPP